MWTSPSGRLWWTKHKLPAHKHSLHHLYLCEKVKKRLPSLLHILHYLQFLRQFFLSEFLDLGLGCHCLDPHDPATPLPPDLLKPLIVVSLYSLHQVVKGSLVLTREREETVDILQLPALFRLLVEIIPFPSTWSTVKENAYFLTPVRHTAVAVFLWTSLPRRAFPLTMQ